MGRCLGGSAAAISIVAYEGLILKLGDEDFFIALVRQTSTGAGTRRSQLIA